jgi:hypothetical protein
MTYDDWKLESPENEDDRLNGPRRRRQARLEYLADQRDEFDGDRMKTAAQKYSESNEDAIQHKSKLNSLPQAAEQLGVTVNCLRGWIYRRAVAYVKVGRAVRISDETIQRIIDRGTMPALEGRR